MMYASQATASRSLRCWSLISLSALLLIPSSGAASVKGDVDGNGRIEMADLLLLSQYVAEGGSHTLTIDEEAADLAPVIDDDSTPDGLIDVGDVVVLMRALAGAYLPTTPVLDPITSISGSNPIEISGTAPAGTEVTYFVDGYAQGSKLADANGDFTFVAVFVSDNVYPPGGANNPIHVVATDTDTGFTSRASNTLYWDFDSEVDHTPTGPITAGTVVWTPGTTGGNCQTCVGPYVIPLGFEVESGGKLVVMPGTELQFPSGQKLTVKGRFLAFGTEADPVVFTR